MKTLLAIILIAAAGAVLAKPVPAQESGLSTNSYCFSCQMKVGSRQFPLLTLPATLQRNERLINSSLGGISGSSFETEEATADQTIRQTQRTSAVPAEPRFTPSLSELRQSSFGGSIFRPQESLSKTFEERYGKSYFDLGRPLGDYAPKLQEKFEFLGHHKRRGELDSLLDRE